MNRFLRKWLNFWAEQGIDGPGVWRSIHYMLMPQHEYSEQMSKRYGKVYGNVGLTNRSLVINDPELIHEVLVDRFNEFPDRFPWHFGTSPKFTKSVALINGNEDWKRIRAVLSPAFSSLKLKAMMSHIIEITDKFIEDIKQNQNFGENN